MLNHFKHNVVFFCENSETTADKYLNVPLLRYRDTRRDVKCYQLSTLVVKNQ